MTTLEKLVVRLVGDGSAYEKMLDHAEKKTKESSKLIEDQTKALVTGFTSKADRMAAAHRAAAQTVKQTGVSYKEALQTAMISIRKAEKASWKFMSVSQKMKTVIRGVGREFKKAGAKMKAFGGTLVGIGGRMSLMFTLPLKLMGLAAVKVASDHGEALSKMEVTFSRVLPGVNKEIELLNKNYMMSRVEAVKLMGDTGDLLTGFGFQQEETLKMSAMTQKLAADLASFSNVQGGAARASRAITKALLGEREMLKDLGVTVRENDKQYKALVKHLIETEKMTDNQAKAQATLITIIKQSPNAIGDVARTMEQLANQFRAMGGNMKDLMYEFGKILVPIFGAVTKKIRIVTMWLTSLDAKWKKIILVVAGTVAVLGPLTVAFGVATIVVGSLVGAVVTLWPFLVTLAGAFAGISAATVAVIAAVSAVAVAIFSLATVTVAWFLWPKKTEKVMRVVRRLFAVFVGWLGGVLARFFLITLPGWIMKGFKAAWKFITSVLPKLAKMLWDAITGKTVDWGSIFDDFKNDMAMGFEQGLGTGIKNVLDEENVDLPNLFKKKKKADALIDDYKDKAKEANDVFDEATKKAGDPAVKAAVKADKALGSMIDSMKQKLSGLTEGAEGVSKLEALEKAGGDIELIKEAKALEASIKKQTKLNEMQKKGADMMKKFRTPQAKFAETTKELNELLAGGHIDMDVFTKSHKEAEKQLQSDLKIKFSTSGIDAALADSTEAMARIEGFRKQVSRNISIPTSKETLAAEFAEDPSGFGKPKKVQTKEDFYADMDATIAAHDAGAAGDEKMTEVVGLLKRIADKAEEDDPSKTTIVAEANFKP